MSCCLCLHFNRSLKKTTKTSISDNDGCFRCCHLLKALIILKTFPKKSKGFNHNKILKIYHNNEQTYLLVFVSHE